MFEYIEIETCIFMMTDRVKIWVEDGKVHYSVDAFMSKQIEIEDNISDIKPEVLFSQLDALHISDWAKNYEPKGCIVLDGENWTVKYKEEGKKVVRKSGENAWPAEWKKLLSLVKSITGEIGEMY